MMEPRGRNRDVGTCDAHTERGAATGAPHAARRGVDRGCQKRVHRGGLLGLGLALPGTLLISSNSN